MLSIGLMSGTSMDGIDAALLETDGTPGLLNELGNVVLIYSAEFKILLKAAEFAIRTKLGNLIQAENFYQDALKIYLQDGLKYPADKIQHKVAQLEKYLAAETKQNSVITIANIIQHSTQLHAQAVNQLLVKTGYQALQIAVVGYHGQTMFHAPALQTSIIVGDAQALADSVSINVVNDFRSADLAAGGQGAPFAPIYHQALAQKANKLPLGVINCGGIANLTLITSLNSEDLIAFDTGPGNGLIDAFVRQVTYGHENMDKDGQYGKQGQVNAEVLAALFEQSIVRARKNYFTELPPKALDIGDMKLIPALNQLSLIDGCATLEAFTAKTIVESLNFMPIEKWPCEWILAGGGWNNPVILKNLTEYLVEKIGNTVQIHRADEIGWNSQAMEAQIFAYLAVRSLKNLPLSFPGTTGVPKPISGGKKYQPNLKANK
jgi:anhydro-N-acetylmuramic acid kinase